MSNIKNIKGQLGVYLVITKLLELDLESISTPHFWIFDIITSNGVKLEVKFGNLAKCRGGSGYSSKRFTFRISEHELDLSDFIVLVLNTHKGYQFYVIPKENITCKTIAFNPFSKSESKYEKYQNRWDLIKNYTSISHNKTSSRGPYLYSHMKKSKK